VERLEEVRQALEEKLERTRRMIDEFDEGMDYATHCTLQGFAEGLYKLLFEAMGRRFAVEQAAASVLSQ